MKKNRFYEKYHAVTKLQKRIINEKNFTYRILLGFLKKFVSDKKTALDIGCGTGTVDFYLANLGIKVVGIDISSRAIKMARENAKYFKLTNETKFISGTFPTTKITGKFDLILLTEIIEHLKDDSGLLKILTKYLTKDGILIITVPSRESVLYKLGLTANFDKRVGHLRRYSMPQLKTLVERNGFKSVFTKKSGGFLREAFFIFPFFGNSIVRVANKFAFVSDFLTILDDVMLDLFGESQLCLVVKKSKI